MKTWLQRITSISLAARVSILVAIMLWVLAAITWWIYAADPTRVGWGSYMTLQRGIALSLTWLVCVACVYGGIRVATDDTPFGHSGARNAWRAGRSLLVRQGMTFRDVPLFLALGAAAPNATPKAAREDGTGESERDDDSCVQWCFHGQGLLANLRGLGRYEPPRWREAIRNIGSHDSLTSVRHGEAVPSRSAMNLAETKTASDESTSPPPSAQATPSQTPASETAVAIPATEAASQPDVEQRLAATIDQADQMLGEALRREPSHTETSTSAYRPQSSTPIESRRSLRREQGLSELLKRLQRERHPFATINGILAVVPSSVLSQEGETDQDRPSVFGKQLQHDLRLVREGLGLDVPITLCLESSSVIDSRSSSMTGSGQSALWGVHLDPAQSWDRASLDGLADRLVASVVERVDDEMLSVVTDGPDRSRVMTRNQKAHRFAAECRQRRSALQAFLAGAFPFSENDDESVRLSGVFIDHPDRILEPDGMLGVMQNQQHELQWTPQTARQQRQQFRGNVAIGFACILLLILAYWQLAM